MKEVYLVWLFILFEICILSRIDLIVFRLFQSIDIPYAIENKEKSFLYLLQYSVHSDPKRNVSTSYVSFGLFIPRRSWNVFEFQIGL